MARPYNRALHRQVVAIHLADPRASHSEIGRRLGVHQQTVGRCLERHAKERAGEPIDPTPEASRTWDEDVREASLAYSARLLTAGVDWAQHVDPRGAQDR